MEYSFLLIHLVIFLWKAIEQILFTKYSNHPILPINLIIEVKCRIFLIKKIFFNFFSLWFWRDTCSKWKLKLSATQAYAIFIFSTLSKYWFYEIINNYFAGIYTAPQPPLPTKRESSCQARRNYPTNRPQKFWYVPEMYKMTKVLEYGRENG